MIEEIYNFTLLDLQEAGGSFGDWFELAQDRES